MLAPSLSRRTARTVQKYLLPIRWREQSVREYIDAFRPTPGVDLSYCLLPRYLAQNELVWELPHAPGCHVHLDNDLEKLLRKVIVRNEDERQVERLSILDFDGIGATRGYTTRDGRHPIRNLQHLALDLPENSKWYKFSNEEDVQEMQSQLADPLALGPAPKAHRQLWNGRLDLDNANGSHRFASVLRYCLDHQQEVYFTCAVETIRVDAEVIRQMLARWHLLIVAQRTRINLYTRLESHDPYRKNPLRYPDQERGEDAGFNRQREGGVDTCIYAIPRRWPHADYLRDSLVQHGPKCAYDLSAYLREIVAAQEQPPSSREKPRGVPGPLGCIGLL